jgi:multimeric flavodoxin WrbA
MSEADLDFSALTALYINTTLTRSPGMSHTQLLVDASAAIMAKHGVQVDQFRSVDYPIATGVYPDMTEHGWEVDAWPELFERVLAADIVVIAGPIWLGDNSSETKKIIERLYAHSGELNDKGQWLYYGRVGGCLITGNEDGIKHCASNVLYSLQHIGFSIAPQSDAGWIGEAGPGPSYGDVDEDGSRVGFDNEFTNRNTTFMTWNLMHLAKMLHESSGFPVYGNQRRDWDAGARFDFPNPEYRS